MNFNNNQPERRHARLQREPSADYPGRSPWDPSPMSWYRGDDFAYKQSVDAFINGIIETAGPAELSTTARQAVMINFLGTQARLMQHNFEAYEDLTQRYDVTDERIAALLDQAHAGTASQTELLELIRDTPLVSVELAKLTHPYGVRSEYLEPMEDLVLTAIDETNGRIFNENERTEPRLKINHHQHHNDHFIATTRQVIGEVGDVQIAKRTANLILVEESLGFDADIAARMKRRLKEESDQQWHERVFVKSGVQDYLKDVEPKDQPDWLLPISTVYYAFRDGRRKRPEKEKNEKSNSLLGELIRGDRVKTELAKATGFLKNS